LDQIWRVSILSPLHSITPYRLAPDFPLGANFPFGNLAGTTVGDVFPDPNLKPEFVTSYEAGAEASLFKNRLNLDFSVYTQTSKDQVLTVALPPSTGFPSALINVGESKSWGYEADVRGNVIRNSKLNWDVSVRYSNNDNKVISLFGGLTRLNALSGFTYGQVTIEKDRPFPYFFGTGYVRDSATNLVIVNANDGYPQRTSALLPFGRTLPKHQLGVGTTLRAGNFNFGANAEYRGGHVVYHDLGRTMAFTGSSKVTTTYDRQPFVWPNSGYKDASGKVVPNNDVATRNGHYTAWVTHYRQIAENFVTSGAFWKLRDVSLGYNLPASLISRAKFIKTASIGVYGRNLVTLLPKNNWYTDPEFSITTGNGLGINTDNITPPVRAYGVTLSVNF
jgi:outer membrane receptor protein involved in Fe transport